MAGRKKTETDATEKSEDQNAKDQTEAPVTEDGLVKVVANNSICFTDPDTGEMTTVKSGTALDVEKEKAEEWYANGTARPFEKGPLDVGAVGKPKPNLNNRDTSPVGKDGENSEESSSAENVV